MHFITHFKVNGGAAIGKPRAAVVVRVERTRDRCALRVQDEGISVLKHDAIVAPLPEAVVVLHANGKVCKPTGRFYVTIESFDPFHMLTDVF